jgi:hypothetical protein
VALCHVEARIAALARQRDELRHTLLKTALDELEEKGAAPTWRVADVGVVGLSVPKAKPVVFDHGAFADFVEGAYGAESVETVRRVIPTQAEEILGSCSETSDLELVSPDGERVPGVILKRGLPYLQVRLDPKLKMVALDEAAVR